MPFQPIDLFEVRLEPVKPVEPRTFSISQLIEQFDAGLTARRYDRYSVSKTLETLIVRADEATEAQRVEVVDSIFEADPHRIHPSTMRRFFAASWPEAVDLFKEVMGSTDPDDLQWGLAARLALCDTALRADKSDRRRLDSAKEKLVAFANSCLGRHELLVDERASGLRGLLELCSRGEIPENRLLEPPRAHEGPKEGDNNEEEGVGRRQRKAGNPHRLPKKNRRGGIPPEKYAGKPADAPAPAPAKPTTEPAATPVPLAAPAPAPPKPAEAPAPTPIPVAPEPPPPAPSPAVTDEEVWGLLARDGRPVEALKKAYQDCLDILSSGGALHPLSSAKFERLKALVDDAKKRLEAAAKADPFAGVEF